MITVMDSNIASKIDSHHSMIQIPHKYCLRLTFLSFTSSSFPPATNAAASIALPFRQFCQLFPLPPQLTHHLIFTLLFLEILFFSLSLSATYVFLLYYTCHLALISFVLFTHLTQARSDTFSHKINIT